MAATAFGARIGVWDVYSAPVAQTQAATTELVAAVSGKRIRLIALNVIAAVTGTLIVKSASTALTGTIPITAYGGTPYNVPIPLLSIPHGGYLDTVAGEALNITTATGYVAGSVIYAVEN
jgi:hypothetical protein